MQKSKPIWRVEDEYCTCCHEEGGHKEDCLLVTWNKKMDKEIKWLNADEDVPEINKHNNLTKIVFVYVKSNKCGFTAYYDYTNDCWFCAYSGRKINSVTHWQELPGPPKAI